MGSAGWLQGAWRLRHSGHLTGYQIPGGINGAGDLVGFYTDGAGNTDGRLASP